MTKDHNVKIMTTKLDKDANIREEGDKKTEWEAQRAYYAPQFGTQACFTAQGASKIVDPLQEGKIDLADGEAVDRMVKRAELMRDMDSGWFETKEQKILILILVAVIITALVSVYGQSQLGEFLQWARPALAAMQAAAAVTPTVL